MAQLMPNRRLLSSNDAAPVEIRRATAESDILLVCEHAGQATPAALGTLGLSPDDFNSHIGWDIGAEAVARRMSDRLGAPLIVQRYSRLVIDCNRPPGSDGSIPKMTGGIHVPGNGGLSPDDAEARKREIFDPYDAAVATTVHEHRFRAIFSIHSFTPDYPGETRPWDLGLLSRRDTMTAQALADKISQSDPSLSIALDQPYQIDDETDWLIPRYAEAKGLSHALIEICNKRIVDESGQDRWAMLLSDAIRTLMDDAE